MERRSLLASMSIALFAILSWRSSLCTQGAPGKIAATANPITGEWTAICQEVNGVFNDLLPFTYKASNGDKKKPLSPYMCRIDKEIIEMGRDDAGKFPQYRFSYTLDHKNQKDTIDLRQHIPLKVTDKEEMNDRASKMQLGIFFLKDDYLIMCFNSNSRPKNFVSSKGNNNWVIVMRRGKMIK